MADNVAFTPGTGATGATDDIGGVHYPRVKLGLGADGTANDAVAGAGAVGTGVQRVTLASDDPGVVAMEAVADATPALGQAAMAASVPVVIASDQSAVPVGSGVAHDAADSGGPVKIGGYASAAAPTGVSGDADRVNAWFLRNGAQAVNLTAAGALIPGDATNGLDVDVTRMVPGTSATHLGKEEDAAHTTADTGVAVLAVRRDAKAVGSGTDGDYSTLNVSADGDLRVDGGKAFVVVVAPTVTAGAYTANDTLGGEMTLTAAARVSGGSGILTAITMAVEDDLANLWVANDVEVLIFKSNPAGTYTDNATLDSSSLTDADAFLLLGSVLLDTASALGNVVLLKATNVNLPYVCSGSADLFAVALNRGGRTPDATDAIQFTFHMIRD